MDVPLDASELRGYARRLRNGISEASSEYVKRCFPLDAGAAVRSQEFLQRWGLFMGGGGADEHGCIVPGNLSIYRTSPLFPDAHKERLAFSLLTFADVNFTFYRKPIETNRYRNIFPSQNPTPDLAFGVVASSPAQQSHELTYEYEGSTILLRSVPIRADSSSFLAKSEQMVSVLDLAGTQVFIEVNPTDPSLSADLDPLRKRLKEKVSLSALELDLGYGKTLKVPLKDLATIRSDWNDPVFVYKLPERL